MADGQFIVEITQENFTQAVIEASHATLVVVDFWAPWCGPCQTLMPLLERLAGEFQGKFILAKVNIDEQPELASRFGVRSVPTVKLIRQGNVVDEFLGAQPESEIRALLDRHIERESDRLLGEALAAYEAGQKEEAIAQISQLVATDPASPRLPLQLIKLLFNEKRYAEAAKQIQALPLDLRQSDEISGMIARLEFITQAESAPEIDSLQQTIAKNPADSKARHQLSALYIMAGEYEKALAQLLEIVQRDRKYADDAGRKDMLKVFDILGNNHSLVATYRQKMSRALY